MSYADDKVKQRLFQQWRGCNSKINDPIWPVFKLVFHPCPYYLHVSGTSDQNWRSYSNNKQRLFQQSRGRNSKIKDQIWPVFEVVRDFNHVHIISKFQEHPIKTEGVIVMTKSNRGLFSNQGDVTLRLMIGSGQFSSFSEISSMSNLSASFRQIKLKPNK